MADGQGQAPGTATGETGIPSQDSSGGQGRGGDAGHAAFWCYQCNKEVVAEPDSGTMVCNECHSGFIEALVTAQTVPDVRRAQRRRRRRGPNAATVVATGTPGAAGQRQMVPLSEALEHIYPQQLFQVLQMLGQATRSNNPASQNQESEGTLQAQDNTNEHASGAESQTGVTSMIQSPGEVQTEGEDSRVQRSREGEDTTAVPTPPGTAEALNVLAHEGHMLFIRDTSPGNPEDADEDIVVSDTETEEGMRLEFDTWDSADEEDEEEWEEVDEDEEEAGGTGVEEGGVGEENDAETQEGEQTEEQHGEERQPRVREFRLRTRNMEHNLHQYLHELLHNLVGQNIEVRVELPNGPLYVGNPGDYVDARGFEQLLQQMAENDNSRRGAPPAAKLAVDALPSISIEQGHLDDGSAVCAICKDVVALGEPAKQLPCLHLYHHDCILPWLSSRNSCPVCRYELPTDDPDYEEQKQSRNGTMQNTGSQSPSSGLETTGGQDSGNGGQDSTNGGGNETQNNSGQQHDESPGQQQNTRHLNFEAVELVGASSTESAEQAASAGGGPHGSSSDCSFFQGQDTTITNPSPWSNGGGEYTRGESESEEVDSEETSRGTGRGWFLLAAGPVLSMMGLVLVLCIGNHLIGGRIQNLGRPLHTQQHFFQEPHIEQIGAASEVQVRRRWWMPFQH